MQGPSQSEALAQLDGMLAEQMATGSIDSEADDFVGIKQRLTSGEITPRAAIAEATELIDSRQDYH